MANTVIVPPQAAPFPQEGQPELVNRLWYLFFHGLARALETNSELEAEGADGLILTTTFQDIPGDAVTLDKDGVWLISCSAFGAVNTAGGELSVQLVVNDVVQTGVAGLILGTGSPADSITASISRTWIYTNVGNNLAKLQANISNAGGGAAGTIFGTDTNIVAVFLHA